MSKKIKRYSKITFLFGLIIVLVAMYGAIPMVNAGTLTSRQVKISDSRPAQTGVDYDFQATETVATNISCIKVEFCTTATGACTAATGIGFAGVDKGDIGDWSGLTYANWAIINTTVNSVTATTSVAEVLGAGGSWVFGNIINPSATSTYFTRIHTYTDQACSVELDKGVTAFAIVSGVTVSATVAPTLTFTIHMIDIHNCLGDTGSPTVIETTTTTVPFGQMNLDTFKVGCHRLDCDTNAPGGYNLTCQENDQLTSGADTIADTTCDGACTEIAFDTWGTSTDHGFGHSCENITGAPCASGYKFSTIPEYRQFASIADGETIQIVMSTSSPASTVAKIHYKIAIGAGQNTGDYSNTIVYIATPTY